MEDPPTLLKESRLRSEGLFARPQRIEHGRIYDERSQAYCSTEFAFTRFLVPLLAVDGWALFTDHDVVFLRDPRCVLQERDRGTAVQVVKHDMRCDKPTKMMGQVQQPYPRKNWSSVMLFNCSHPAHRRLSLDDVNERDGKWLHQLRWLRDDEIGELPAGWNWLVNAQPMPEREVSLAHFTLGGPWLEGWPGAPHDDLWVRHAR